jgi:hypothetical protein
MAARSAVDADDVALASQLDCLGAIVDVSPALLDHQRHEGRGIVEHDVTHQLVGPLARTKDVEQATRLQRGDGLGTDHAAVSDDTEPANGEAPAQPIDHWDQGRDIGGVAGPHLRAHRPSIAVDHHGEDHLMQVGPVVLAEPMLAERLPALAFEIQAGRVHEHKVEPAEQIAPMGEQLLLDQILHATRRERRCRILLIGGEGLAEPGHRTIDRTYPLNSPKVADGRRFW